MSVDGKMRACMLWPALIIKCVFNILERTYKVNQISLSVIQTGLTFAISNE